jgi:hypothetical protein
MEVGTSIPYGRDSVTEVGSWELEDGRPKTEEDRRLG